MRILSLSYQNLKRNLSSYLSFLISLSFCTFILYNFLHLIDSGTLDILGERNKEFSEMIILTITVVLVFFVFCFIWYASNVFLTQRKKEMGTFIFMGLDNKQLGRMYFLEMLMVGVIAILTGIIIGVIFSKVFGMLFFKISDIEGDIPFGFQLATILKTSLIFLSIYSILMMKGYIQIVRTSIKDMLDATKQSECKKAQGFLTLLKAVIALVILLAGYACAMQVGDMNSFGYMLLATVFVILGTYMLFHSLMPYCLTKLSNHKGFLYRKERNLWVNHLIFRIQKNYRTYAIVTVMMLCCISALGAGLAMKQRHDAILSSQSLFTYSFLGDGDIDIPKKELQDIVLQDHEIKREASISMLPHVYHQEPYTSDQIKMIISYSAFTSYCEQAGLAPIQMEIEEGQGIVLRRKILLSMANETSKPIPFGNQEIEVIASQDIAYFGMMQDQSDFLIVTDATFQALSAGQPLFELYNVAISEPADASRGVDKLRSYIAQHGGDHISTIIANPSSNELAFVRVMYAVCIFMFAVFVFCSGGVIFMKTYNDSSDDRLRYQVLKNMGISPYNLHRAIVRELAFIYIFPILLTMLSSFFIMHAIKSLMRSESLLGIACISLLIVFILYMFLYKITIVSFEKKCEIK